MNKKLFIIGSSLNYGSPGKITESLGLLAQKQGWTVYQAHGLKYSRKSQLITRPVSSSWDEKIHAACSLLLDAHGLASKSGTEKLIKWIDEIKPDIIHLHNIHGYYLNYPVLFQYLSSVNTPIVWTLHDFWPITGHCAHFDYVGCNKWKNGCHDCQQTGTYPKSLFFDKSTRNYQLKKECFTSIKDMTIVPVSKWVGHLIQESFLGKYPIVPIYNGIDTSIFKPTISNLREVLHLQDKFVLLGVACPWYPLKGLYDYYMLSNILSNEYQIVMIGLTRNQIRRLPKNIIGIERTTDQQQLAEYYSMADATLNLSYQETFGMTTIEGMGCGTPGIVYDRTASPELVTPETGIVVKAGDIKAIVNAIHLLKSNKNNYSHACQERVLTYFDKHTQFQKYMDLYSQICNFNN